LIFFPLFLVNYIKRFDMLFIPFCFVLFSFLELNSILNCWCFQQQGTSLVPQCYSASFFFAKLPYEPDIFIDVLQNGKISQIQLLIRNSMRIQKINFVTWYVSHLRSTMSYIIKYGRLTIHFHLCCLYLMGRRSVVLYRSDTTVYGFQSKKTHGFSFRWTERSCSQLPVRVLSQFSLLEAFITSDLRSVIFRSSLPASSTSNSRPTHLNLSKLWLLPFVSIANLPKVLRRTSHWLRRLDVLMITPWCRLVWIKTKEI
jgi:hypothetical protein